MFREVEYKGFHIYKMIGGIIMKKRNNKRSKVLLAQAIFLAVAIAFFIFSMNVFAKSLHLFFISDDIHFMEEDGRWTDVDHERYDELIAERLQVKDSSVVGFLLVVSGANVFTQILRMIILFGLFIANCFSIYLCGSILKSDFLYLKKRISKKFKKH